MFIEKRLMKFICLLVSALSAFLFAPSSLSGACTCSLELQSSPTMTNTAISVDPNDSVTISTTLTYSCSSEVSTELMSVSQVPEGMQFVDNGNGKATLSGTPTVANTYTLVFGGQVYNDTENTTLFCSKTTTITLTVNAPLPPEEFTAEQQSMGVNEQWIDQATKAKQQNNVRFKNILKWKAPILGTPIVAYRIYLDRDLQHMVGEIPSSNRKRFKVVHRRVNPCIIHKYFIVSVDEFGNLSRVVKGRVKGARRHCFFNQ